MKFQVASFNPRPYFIFRRSGRAVGAVTTHIDDTPGLGEADVVSDGRCSAEHRGHGKSIVRSGLEVSRTNDFSALFTQDDFTNGLRPISTSPELRGPVGDARCR